MAARRAAVWCVVLAAVPGCGSDPMYKAAGPPKVTLAMRRATIDPFPGATELALPESEQFFDVDGKRKVPILYVAPEVVLANADVVGTGAHKSRFETGYWDVELFLTPGGRATIAAFTRENVGNHLAIFFDDKFRMAPRIAAELTEGKVVISGRFTETEATALAKGLVGQ